MTLRHCFFAGLLGQMFDGVLRPLEQIKALSGGIYIPRGLNIPALPRDILWDYKPNPSVQVVCLRNCRQMDLQQLLTCRWDLV